MKQLCSLMSRKYQQRARAEAQEETRRRITEATVELHATVGPARTTISAIAERAGVQRLTVYRHFPDERSLFAACSAHWLGADPPPDPSAWAAIEAVDERTRTALTELYGWYRRNDAMLTNTQRDALALPALAEIADPGPFLEAMRQVLMRGRPRRKRVRAALGHALEFSTWRSLARQGLSDGEAAEMMTAFAEERP
jgi:AcrR family transcriptional regulator